MRPTSSWSNSVSGGVARATPNPVRPPSPARVPRPAGDVALARWREPPRNPRTQAERRDVQPDFPPMSEPPEPVPAPDVRASDADRDRVIDVLRAATADGRLTADGFSDG